MIFESRARNRGSIVDEEELILVETQRFRDSVQERIDELEKMKERI
jgi:hypothetical protein